MLNQLRLLKEVSGIEGFVANDIVAVMDVGYE
jgi:hypothetical protein